MELLSASPIYDEYDDLCINLIFHPSARKFFQGLLVQTSGKSGL